MPEVAPVHVMQFARWQSAPAEQRDAIARQQFANFPVSDIFPDRFMQPSESLAEIIAPNGKLFAECTSAELSEILAWYGSIVKAGRDLNKAMVLCAEETRI